MEEDPALAPADDSVLAGAAPPGASPSQSDSSNAFLHSVDEDSGFFADDGRDETPPPPHGDEELPSEVYSPDFHV